MSQAGQFGGFVGEQRRDPAVEQVAVRGKASLPPSFLARRDEQRIVEPCGLQVEEAAEAAEVGVGPGSSCRTGERGYGTDQRVTGLDRYAGLCICICGGLVMLGIHGPRD